MKVQILGTGCSKCRTLEERIRQIVMQHRLPVEIEKITEIQEIIKYGIWTTPGLVIDGVVKSVGFIPKEAQLLEWLKETSS